MRLWIGGHAVLDAQSGSDFAVYIGDNDVRAPSQWDLLKIFQVGLGGLGARAARIGHRDIPSRRKDGGTSCDCSQ
jgi:hypothetical protein